MHQSIQGQSEGLVISLEQHFADLLAHSPRIIKHREIAYELQVCPFFSPTLLLVIG